MTIKEISTTNLDIIKDSEFSILFIRAEGCKYCEQAKELVEEAALAFPKIQFLSSEISQINEYYVKYAETEDEMVYVPMKGPDGVELLDKDGSFIMEHKSVLMEDGSISKKIKYVIPSFYIHHIKAITEDNPYGFIGGTDGASKEELFGICDMISRL